MIKTDKLLPLINKINQDKKKLNGPKPGLPAKTQAKAMSKPIITNQDGQDLFPGMPTLIQGKGAGTSITMRNTNPQIALTPYGASFMQPNMNYNFAGNSVLELPVAQMGGDPQQDQLMQMIQIYAQMKQMDPNELMQKIQSLPQDQQQQALQSISQEVQQAMAQQQQAGQEGQEQMPEEGMMSQGGEPCIDCFDNYNPSPQAQNLEWYYKKAKGGELPKHQWATSQTGTPQLGNPAMNPYLLQKIQESMQTQTTKAAPTTQDILAEARRMPTMASDATSVAAVQQKKQELNKDIKDYGSFENAQKAKTIKKAQQDQAQSQVYQTIDINPNEYALAAMSSPYTGNDPRIIRDAANQTNRQMAPIAAGALAATVAPWTPSMHQVSHGLHKGFTWSPFKGLGLPGINAGNYFTVDMLTDAYERAPAWGNALDKAMKTGSKEDINELVRLSALQGLDMSAIAGIPTLISSGVKLPAKLAKLRNLAQTTKFAQTAKEFEGLVHLGKKVSKKGLKEEEDPTTGKWGRYASALMGPNPGMQSLDQTFIPESTGVYPNYLNIPASVATDFYGSRKEGGSALPQHQGRISQTGQNQIASRDNTRTVLPNIKGIQQMDAFNQAIQKLYGPYTSVSYPDLQTKTPGDSVHLYPGQGNVYFRDFANLVGFSDKTPMDLYNLSKDPRVVVRQDSSWVNANPQYMKNLPSSVRDSLKKEMQPIAGKKGGGEAFPQANEYPTDWASYHGNQYMEGGEAFPQAQTYLPYSRLRRFAQGGPDKPVKGKMDPSAGEMSEAELAQYEAEQAAQQAAAQAQQAEMNQALGYGFYNFDDHVQPYKGMVSPASIPSNQNGYATAPYFGSSDRYSQVTRPVNLQGAQEIELLRPTQGISGAYGMTPVQTTQPVASTQTSPQTSPVANPTANPGTPPVTNVDDSKWFSNSNIRKNYFELGIQPKANVKMRPDENTFQNQSLAIPISLGFGNNKYGFNVSGGLNFDKSIANPATVISSDVNSPNTSPVRMTTAPITFGATRTGTNSKLGVTGGYSPDSGDFNVGANYTLKFGKKPEQRDGGSFETRPNFMFAEGGDTDDQFGGQLDMDSIYKIMKAGGLAKDPKKKKGKELSPADFMAYVRSQASKKKVGGEMLPQHQGATSQTGTFKDPTGNADWTYSYNNGAWTAYDKAGKSYDISKNPKYKTSVDKLNAAYPGGKDPNAVTNNTSNPANPANTNTGTTTTNQGTTANQGAPAGNTTTSANPSGAISANPLDYLNMVNSQTGNKGIVGALTSVANAANLVGYLGTGWGSGEKKEKEKKPQTPNIPIQQQNENKQAKTNLTQKVNEYKNDYVYPQSTPEVDPLAGGDFMSSMDSQYPMQQNYTSGYDAYRMQEDGKNPTAMQPKQASTLYTTQDNSTVKRSPKVPLTGPYMRPQDRPSPYEQWKEDVNDPNNMNYQFNERGDGVSGVKNPMSIDAYPFDFYQPINDNPYQRSYRRGGDIYLPKHQTNPIVVSGMQGQGQSINLSQNNNLSQPGSNPYNLYSTQTPAAVQNSAGYQAVQTANQDATRIADQNVTAQGTDTTGGAPSASSTQKSAAPKFRPGVMDFGEVGSNGKHLTFDVAGASRAVGGLGQIKDYLANINEQKQADKLAAKLNTSEFMGMAQMGGMQDMGDYLVNATQGPSFRPNAYTQAQKQSEVRMEQPLLYGRMGGTLDMYEDGEEYDLTQEEIDQILAAGGTVEYI